jgi:hypothetical protein
MGAGLWMLWVGGGQCIASADRLLLAPNSYAAAYLKTWGQTQLRPLAHYLANEQNRSRLQSWGVVQIVLGGVFFFLLFGTRLGKFPLIVALLMLILVIAERVAITPGMEMVGQYTDFKTGPIAPRPRGERRAELWFQDGRRGQVRARGDHGSLSDLAGTPVFTRLPEAGRHDRYSRLPPYQSVIADGLRPSWR